MPGNEHGADYLFNDGQIAYFTGSGAVKVDDVKSRRPQGLPFESYIEGVIGEDRFLVIIALVKAYAASVPDVNRRYDFYFIPPE
jgi:hypothetical protein